MSDRHVRAQCTVVLYRRTSEHFSTGERPKANGFLESYTILHIHARQDLLPMRTHCMTIHLNWENPSYSWYFYTANLYLQLLCQIIFFKRNKKKTSFLLKGPESVNFELRNVAMEMTLQRFGGQLKQGGIKQPFSRFFQLGDSLLKSVCLRTLQLTVYLGTSLATHLNTEWQANFTGWLGVKYKSLQNC